MQGQKHRTAPSHPLHITDYPFISNVMAKWIEIDRRISVWALFEEKWGEFEGNGQHFIAFSSLRGQTLNRLYAGSVVLGRLIPGQILRGIWFCRLLIYTLAEPNYLVIFFFL